MTFQNFPPALLVLSPRLTRTGAAAFSVAGVNTTELGDGCFCYCIENKGEYQLDRTSTAVPDGTTIIQPSAGPGRWLLQTGSSGGESDTVFDAVREAATVPMQTTLADAALTTPVPRDSGGTPLSCTMPSWTAGDVLEIQWGSQGFVSTTSGASGFIVPTVDVGDGAGFKYVDNAAVIALGNALGVANAGGMCMLQINTFTAPPVIQLALAAFSPSPGDTVIFTGGAPLNLSVLNSFGSTYLRCRRLSATSVNVGTLPPYTLTALPIPSS